MRAPSSGEHHLIDIGADFTYAELQTCSTPREDHAAHLACWLEVIKQDKKAIFTAATQTQRVVDYLTTR